MIQRQHVDFHMVKEKDSTDDLVWSEIEDDNQLPLPQISAKENLAASEYN